MGLRKICCMVKARLACPSGQDRGITASWLREDRAGARAAFSLPREFAGLSQGGDRQVPAAASAGGHGCTGESAPPTSYIWPWALPPTWSDTSGLLSAASKKLALIAPSLTDLILCITGTTYRCCEWWFWAEERALTWASGVTDMLWDLRPQFSSLSSVNTLIKRVLVLACCRQCSTATF